MILHPDAWKEVVEVAETTPKKPIKSKYDDILKKLINKKWNLKKIKTFKKKLKHFKMKKKIKEKTNSGTNLPH